jgi:hypothetical protein
VREAAACSLPTVLIRGSCAAEDTTDGENVFWIEENAQSMAEMLRALGTRFDVMRRVGEGAASQLYISWEQAIARAWARYEIVIERYRRGEYPAHQSSMDNFFSAQGKLMEAMHWVSERRPRLERERMSQRKEEADDDTPSQAEENQEERKEQLGMWDRYM